MTARVRLLVLSFAAVAFLFGCSKTNRGFQVSTQTLPQDAVLGILRPDIPTTVRVLVTKPFVPPGSADLVEVPTGPFQAAPGAFPADAGTGIEFRFSVLFDPQGQNGIVNGSMTIRFTRVDEAVTQEIVVNFTAQVESPVVELATASVDFGRTAVGEAVTKNIGIRNPNVATPVSITGAIGPGGAFRLAPSLVFPIVVLPGTTRGIPIVYSPPDTASHSSSVQLQNTITSPLPASMSGQGMPGEVVLFDMDLSPHDLDPEGLSDVIEFTLPAEAVSLNISAVENGLRVVDIESLVYPLSQGERVYTKEFEGPWDWLDNLPNGDTSLDYEDPFPANSLVAMLPNTDLFDGQLVDGGGTYSLQFRSAPFGQLFYRISYQQRNAGKVNVGTLPLNVFIASSLGAGKDGFDAAGARNDEKLQEAIQIARDLLSLHGIHIGEIAYWDDVFGDLNNLFNQRDLEDAMADGIPFTMDEFGSSSYFDDLATNNERLNVVVTNQIGGGNIDPSVIDWVGGLPVPKVGSAELVQIFGSFSYSGLAVQYTNTQTQDLGERLAASIMNALGVTTFVNPHDVRRDQSQVAIRSEWLKPGRPPN